jgi:hypothetical protein
MSDPSGQELYDQFLKMVVPYLQANTLILRYLADAALHKHANPLNAHGAKVYSQSDEDGITFEILRRLKIGGGVFAELGVGDGTENNTLALIAAGWGGFWLGNEELTFDCNPGNVEHPNFSYERSWISRVNVVGLYQDGLAAIRQDHCDVISVDLDGNDLYIVEALLESGAAPRLFIVEYNATFLPPIKFSIDYDESHTWIGDDYMGASLASFDELFERFGYFLVACNITGSNAFFVRSEDAASFADVPRQIDLLYAPPKYFLTGLDSRGHPISIRTIERHFRELNSQAEQPV